MSDRSREYSKKEEEETKAGSKSTERRSRTGFNKRLLKNEHGQEQCFEEARANASCFTLVSGSAMNFNFLFLSKRDQSSVMDLDNEEECSADISMTEASMASTQMSVKGQKQSFIQNRSGSRRGAKRLFRQESSFEIGLNQTAISNASSTINDVDAVGIPGKREEETINTKLAMRELSMMFSSPAIGTNSVRKRPNQSGQTSIINESTTGGQNDTSLNLADALGNVRLDNSIFHSHGQQSTSGYPSPTSAEQPETATDGGAEFTVYEEEMNTQEDPAARGLRFSIFQDDSLSDQKAKALSSTKRETDDTASLSDAMEFLNTLTESSPRATENIFDKHGDTATMSIINGILQHNQPESENHPQSNRAPASGRFEIFFDEEAGETNDVS